MSVRPRAGKRARWTIAAAACFAVALVAAIASVKTVHVFPPGLGPRPVTIAAAQTRALVDLPPSSSVLNHRTTGYTADSLARRTVLLGRLATSAPVLADVARRTGVAPQQIAGVTEYTANIPLQMSDPESETRADQILQSRKPYRLDIQPTPGMPSFDVYAQAPSVFEAQRLADAAVPALRDYLRAQGLRYGISPAREVRILQLGAARGAVVNGTVKGEIVGLTFLVALFLSAAAILLVSRVRAGWIAAGPHGPPAPSPSAPQGAVAAWDAPPTRRRPGRLPSVGSRSGRVRVPAKSRARPSRARWAMTRWRSWIGEHADGDWPRTTRVLPWMMAGFIAMIWLVPFDSIQLTVHLPIDMKLDRLVLPVIAGTWVLAVVVGGPFAPRVRVTWVHAAVGLFAALACLSVVLDATYLNETFAFDRGVKRLTLLASYVWFFVMLASIVRRSEIKAFLRYTLMLAVVVAIGMIWEYRFSYNVFYEMSRKLLPGFFSVQVPDAAAVDDLGRRLVRGPAEVPLEAVAMMTMALPLALVGLLDAKRWAGRLAYALAAGLLLAATVATFRKSAFIGPIVVILVLAYYRRSELLRLAPLGLVVLLAVMVLAPGALGGVAFQLDSNRLGVTTVSDRTSDYDAVRPDVWGHLVFGQGFGTYTARVLDNELLGRLVEGGVLGLASYVLMIVSLLALARGPIRRRDPSLAAISLASASGAIGFLVLSTLFDVMGFPHAPYVFLCIAAFLVAAVKGEEATTAGRPAGRNAVHDRLKRGGARRMPRAGAAAGAHRSAPRRPARAAAR